MKTSLQIAKKGDPEDRKAKDPARANNNNNNKKQTTEWIRALQTAQKTTPQEKSWVEVGSGKECETDALRKEKGTLHKRKQAY